MSKTHHVFGLKKTPQTRQEEAEDSNRETAGVKTSRRQGAWLVPAPERECGLKGWKQVIDTIRIETYFKNTKPLFQYQQRIGAIRRRWRVVTGSLMGKPVQYSHEREERLGRPGEWKCFMTFINIVDSDIREDVAYVQVKLQPWLFTHLNHSFSVLKMGTIVLFLPTSWGLKIKSDYVCQSTL